MAYADLLRALSDEADREVQAIADAAAHEAARLVDDARSEAARRRDEAMRTSEDAHRRAAEMARAAASRQAEAAVLREARRQLDLLRDAALEALRGRAGILLPSLVDELAAAAHSGPAVFVVDPGEEEHVREHLGRAHPDVARTATVRAAAVARGGVELEQDGVTLDDTLPARLDRAWAALEPRLAAMLFGEADEPV